MKRRKIPIILTISLILCISVSGIISLMHFSTMQTNPTIQFNKVEIKPAGDRINAYASRETFDLEAIITGNNHTFNTIIFQGKITNLEEYEISWIDENNEQWGPYSRSIITVELSDIYHGKNPAKSNTIKVLYPNSLSLNFDKSVKIELNKEYVFSNCWILDNQYRNYIKNNNLNYYNNDISINHADVIMGGAWNSLFPVENDSVTLYHEYFNSVDDIKSKTLPYDEKNAARLTNKDALKNGDFVSLKNTDFENEFDKLLKKFDK